MFVCDILQIVHEMIGLHTCLPTCLSDRPQMAAAVLTVGGKFSLMSETF